MVLSNSQRDLVGLVIDESILEGRLWPSRSGPTNEEKDFRSRLRRGILLKEDLPMVIEQVGRILKGSGDCLPIEIDPDGRGQFEGLLDQLRREPNVL